MFANDDSVSILVIKFIPSAISMVLWSIYGVYGDYNFSALFKTFRRRYDKLSVENMQISMLYR